MLEIAGKLQSVCASAPLARLFRGTGGDACQRKRGTAGRPAQKDLGEREKFFVRSIPSISLSAAHLYTHPMHRVGERERTHKVRLGCSQSALSCAILVMHRPLPLNARCPQQKLTWLFVSLSLWLFPLVSARARARLLHSELVAALSGRSGKRNEAR
jgi:hypothetical protein